MVRERERYMAKRKHKINVLGSCISRVVLLDGDYNAHGVADENIEFGYFLDKQNIVCALLEAPFEREEIELIKSEELWNKKAIYSVKQCLAKDTVKLLMESDADYLIIDFYDFHTDMGVFGNTLFSTCAHEFFNTALYQKHKDEVNLANFMYMPKETWYPYVDKFFEIIMQKYDSNHLILNRFRSSTYFLDTDGKIKLLPDTFKQGFQSNDKYNVQIAELEDYVIDK